MSATTNVNDLLGSGAPAFKFESIGDTAKGVIIDASKQPVTNISSGEVEKWPDGKDKQQLVITLRQDDGEEVRVFCKYAAEQAIIKARDEAGADFEIGGRLALQYSGDEPSKQKGFNPKKLFVAQYQSPTKDTDKAADDLLGG